MKISYYSSSVINVVGVRADVASFFEVINAFVVPRRQDVDLSIITDRLYRRYIRQDQADHAEQVMRLIEEEFSRIKPNELAWKQVHIDPKQSALDLTKGNLAETFSKYFSKLYESLASPAYDFAHGRKYKPLRIARSDMPYFYADKERPLEAYEQLEGTPFWLMPDDQANAGSRWFTINGTAAAKSYKNGKEVPHGTPGSVRPNSVSSDGQSASFVVNLKE